MQRIAIIGAGITGTMLASLLHTRAQVSVFEKARGVGGRMSVRYAPPYAFDHGTPFFSARSDAFRAFLQPLIARGIVAAWSPRMVQLAPGRTPEPYTEEAALYVACPHMHGLCKFLVQGVTVTTTTEIATLRPRGETGWALQDTHGTALGTFDTVISTAPYQQTARLFADVLPADAPLPERPLDGCFALMLGLTGDWPHPWQVAHASDSPLERLSLNHRKPGREASGTALVVQATQAWSHTHMEDAPADVEQALLTALAALGIDTGPIAHQALHRWRYAQAAASGLDAPYLHASGLAAAGDWTSAATGVEGAWAQAAALARML